ncbi:hypothetical protein [Haloarchaeobius amylolyticus]|nr:hypothetical protein [Haloarchaeobius amylolyticus]
MMSLKQKVIAFATIFFLNLLVLLFMGGFVVFSLIPSVMLGLAILAQ